MELKRRIFAGVLLAVLLPMILLSALHTHEDVVAAADNCVECASHLPHAGHLTASSTTMTDCVLCQFISLQYFEAIAVTLVVAVSLVVLTRAAVTVSCPSRPLTLHASRAPPCCF